MRILSYGGVGALVAALALLFVGLPLYAVDMAGDFGRQVSYQPLVRHMISQVHCYDLGTHGCEETDLFGTFFAKEHTLGFLLDGSRFRMAGLGMEPLYLCEARDDSGTMMVTAGTTEEDPRRACREADHRAKHVGYLAPEATLEASWPLYRCVHGDTHDTLLTDTTSECSSAGYGEAELLGYLYAGGPQTIEE